MVQARPIVARIHRRHNEKPLSPSGNIRCAITLAT
jgi:hypothetical protein